MKDDKIIPREQKCEESTKVSWKQIGFESLKKIKLPLKF